MRIDCSKISEPASEVVAERKIESEQIGLDDGAQHYLCFAFARAGGQPPDAAFFTLQFISWPAISRLANRPIQG